MENRRFYFVRFTSEVGGTVDTPETESLDAALDIIRSMATVELRPRVAIMLMVVNVPVGGE